MNFDEKNFGVDTNKLLKLNAFKRPCSNKEYYIKKLNVLLELMTHDKVYDLPDWVCRKSTVEAIRDHIINDTYRLFWTEWLTRCNQVWKQIINE